MAKLLDPDSLSLTQLEAELTGQSSVIISKADSFSSLQTLAQSITEDNLLVLFTSGTRQKKLIALNKNSIFCSAKAVNSWLSVNSSDIWGIALPLSHIGGLSIFFRCKLAGCVYKRFAEKWDANKFSDFSAQNRISLVSLVPTQLYDLVKKGISADKSLRLALIGGDRLDRSLYLEARKLGWPVLPTYGMTECASSVACARIDSLKNPAEYPELFILPHLHVRTDPDQRLTVLGDSVLSFSVTTLPDGNFEISNCDRQKGFRTEDLGGLGPNGELHIFGRADRQIKIRGHLVQPEKYEDIARELFSSLGVKADCAAISRNNPREGNSIHLFYSAASDQPDLKKNLNDIFTNRTDRLPEPTGIFWLKSLPLLSNGKIDYASLTKISEQG